MALFGITYDLIKEKNYKVVWDALEEKGAHRVTESFWLANLDNTAKEVCNWMAGLTDDDDRIFVTKISRSTSHYINAMAGTNKWFDANA